MQTSFLVPAILCFLVILFAACYRLYGDLQHTRKKNENASLKPDLSVQNQKQPDDAHTGSGQLRHTFDAQVIKALQETALAYFYINLTKDRIIGGVLQEYADGTVINVLESAGLEDNCPMSDFVKAWRSFTAEDSLKDYDEFFDLQHNIELYKQGARSVSLTYKTVNAKHEETWAKQTMLFADDLETGDVIAYCYANDMTMEMQRAGAKEPAEHGVIVAYGDQTGGMTESPLIQALKESVLLYFYVNLTQNRIVGSIIQDFDDGTSIDVLKNLGLSDNCRLSEFVEAWRAFVDKQFLSAYDDFFNIDNLIENFRMGILENSLIYKTFNARGEDLWAKQTFLLSKDAETGDILAFVYAHDVTIEMQRDR